MISSLPNNQLVGKPVKEEIYSNKLINSKIIQFVLFSVFGFIFYANNALASLAYVSQPMTWQNAEAYAQANFPGGHLVTINSAEENTAVMAMVNTYDTVVWLGYNDIAEEANWQWSSGESPVFNPPWASGNPDNWTGHNDAGEDAALMLTNGEWQDQSTDYARSFVVEFDDTGKFYFQSFGGGSMKSLDAIDLDASSVIQRGLSSDISTDVVSSVDNFVLRFSGEFFVAGGDVTFQLSSDDGSRLYIDNELVLLNDGLHAVSTLSTTLNLSNGWHPIRVDYFELTGEQTLELLYQTAEMNIPQSIGDAIIRAGADRDGDFYSDSSDTLFASGCDLNLLVDPSVTDYRNCNFDGQDFPDGTYRNKVFDNSSFRNTNLSNVTFIDSSFKWAVLVDQYRQNGYGGISYSGNVTFINSNLSSAQVEKHWPNVRFYNVNFSSARFKTFDSDNYDSSWFCYKNSRFLESDLARIELPSEMAGDQNYRLGVPAANSSGDLKWELYNWSHSCVSDIGLDSASSIPELANTPINIAPVIFLQQELGRRGLVNFRKIDPYNYPIFGNDLKSSYRNAAAEPSPYWEWDMGNYYHMDSIRIYKNSENVNELDNAVVLISEWPFGESPLIQSDFDSMVRYQLNPTGKPYYEIPLNRSVRYIRIQRPIDGTDQFLSFKKLAMFGNQTPLAAASTPQPANFVPPRFESNRTECEEYMFDETRLDPSFDYLAAVLPDEQGRTYWNKADLARQIKNNANFHWSELYNTNFEQSELVGADFRQADALSANFRGANLEGADFYGANLYGADFRGANLKNANFSTTDLSCAYFSGEIPASYTPRGEWDPVNAPMISHLAGNSAYGYARSSSIDLNGYPSLAVDNDPATSSITAVEKSPWWELDMGAIYVLSSVALDTEHDLVTTEQLELFISDWPLPFDFNGVEVEGQIYRITDFEIDPDDASKIKFNTEQTGRFIHIRAPASLGELRLRLAEVNALTPVLPSAPSSSMPLTNAQANNLVPETQNLLNQIDRLIDFYQKTDPNDGVESARETVTSLMILALNSIKASHGAIEIQRNFRKITRPVDSSMLLMKRLEVLPSAKPVAKRFANRMKPVRRLFTALNYSTHVIQQNVNLINDNLKNQITAATVANKEIGSQVSILKTGRSYVETIQRCALYGSNSDQVRAALESYSSFAATGINSIIKEIDDQALVASSTSEARQYTQQVFELYTIPAIDDIYQTSKDVVEAMGPFAAAITPLQLLFAGGEIYDGFTLWDIVDLFADVSDWFLSLPGISDILDFVEKLLSPLFAEIESVLNQLVGKIISGPLAGPLAKTQSLLDQYVNDIIWLANQIKGDAEVYYIPNVNNDTFVDVMNISGGSIFTSCRDSLNLPPQWPEAENDDDGDGLLNAFEIGYAPDNIDPVTNTLSDNPDSDLDGLTDYFEWYWSSQASADDTVFFPTNGSLNEAQRDDDGDGLSSIQEQFYQTNPYVADTDGDGIIDGDEVKWRTNPLSEVGDLSDLELDLDDDTVTIAQELVYQLDPINPLDIYEDPDMDGVPTDQEILQFSSPLIAAPVQFLQTISEIVDPQVLNNEVSIDLNDWVSYSGSDLMVIDKQVSTISEGELIIDDPNLLRVRYKLNAVDQNSRRAYLLVKLKSEGGDLVVRILININFPDTDNDGVNDLLDNCIAIANPDQLDFDLDGAGDVCDLDDDNDGVADVDDVFPLDASEWVDTDGDGVGNNADTDDDNDGVLDDDDAFPLDETESQDSDGDGIGDNSDPTPYPPSGELNFDSTDYMVAENGASVVITVSRINGDYGALTVDYSLQDGADSNAATASVDYEFSSGRLSFIDGEVSQTFTVTILDDSYYEGDETFTAGISNIVGGDGTIGSIASAVITIAEDDAVPPAGEIGFEFDSKTVIENDSDVTLNVQRTGGSFGELSVNYASFDGSAIVGTDYRVLSDSLTFADGETQKTIVVNLFNDDIYEPDETFTVQLSNLIGDGVLGINLSTITILDDEPIPEAGVLEIENANYIINENDGSLAINVIRVDGDVGTVSVDISTSDLTAIASEDYETISQTLSFADGEGLKSITLNIVDDSSYEGEEVFSLNLSNVVGTSLGNQSTSTIAIVEDDEVPPAGVIQFSGASYSVDENAGSILITVTRANGSFGSARVNVATVDGTAIADEDYLTPTETLTFLDGETSQTISIIILDDVEYESNESFNLVLSNLEGDAALGNPDTVTVTIVEDDAIPPAGVLQLSGNSYTVNEADGGVIITVQRTEGSHGDVSVDYSVTDNQAINGSDYSVSDGTLYFGDGEMSQTITIDIIDDRLDEVTETLTVSLSNAVSATLGSIQTASVSITDNDGSSNGGGGGSFNFWWLLAGLILLNSQRRQGHL